MNKMIKILIVDDHAIVREGLKQIVAEENDMIVSGEAKDASELFKLVNDGQFDIAIIDISMPGRSGLDALKDLKKSKPELPVLILSMFSEEQYGLRAIKAGAAGYMKKVSAPDELVSAIRIIVNGGKYINQSLAEKMVGEYVGRAKPQLHERLSDREYQIMCLIATGRTAEEISNDLSISVHTVYTYRNRILDKMQLKSNVELTQYAIRNKLIEL
jgi:DNA-binding NarL/FixJ family response regulator